MIFRQLFDPESATYTYILADRGTQEAVIIDPVRDQVERDTEILEQLGLNLLFVLETHVHADHVTSAGVLRRRFGAKTASGRHGGPACADMLLQHGELVRFGACSLEARETPGHTSGCTTYVLSDRKMAFTGDALLIRGCGRTDFQQGDARTLYRSVHDQILSLPADTLLYPAHDYKGRTVTSVAEELRYNPRLGANKTVEEFVEIMANLNLAKPKKIEEALPANLRCGLSAEDTVSGEPVPERAWAAISRTVGGVPEVGPQWLNVHPEEVRVIDVREPHELLAGRIKSVENVPLGAIKEVASGWDANEPLVLVCRSGGRSGRAAIELEALGFRRVASLRGGMIDWVQQKFEVAL